MSCRGDVRINIAIECPKWGHLPTSAIVTSRSVLPPQVDIVSLATHVGYTDRWEYSFHAPNARENSENAEIDDG